MIYTDRLFRMKNKSYDSIIAIGCSHMYGYEHANTKNNQNPSTETWINHIGKNLDLPVYNFSLPGASNQTILRRLYFAIEFAKTQNLSPLFILQWTGLERYETYVQSAHYVCKEWPWLRTLGELLENSGSKKLTAWAKNFYKLFGEQTLLFESLKSIDHANILLNTNGYKTINCLAHGWDLDSIDFPHVTHYVASSEFEKNNPYNFTVEKIYLDKSFLHNETMKKENSIDGYVSVGNQNFKHDALFSLLWKNIDSYTWWHYNAEAYTVGLKKFCIDHGLEFGPEGHPMESANYYVAKHMLNNRNFTNLL